MTDINTIILIGRLTRDLGSNDFAYTNGGVARANISIAVNRSTKKGNEWKDEVSFFDITVWGKTAENLKPYLTKGKKIAVEGFIKQERWEKDGKTHSKIAIVAESIQLLESKNENNGNNANYSNNYSNNAQRKGNYSNNANNAQSYYPNNGKPPYEQEVHDNYLAMQEEIPF